MFASHFKYHTQQDANDAIRRFNARGYTVSAPWMDDNLMWCVTVMY